jgi:hypothetical protein
VREAGQNLERWDKDSSEDSGEGSGDEIEVSRAIIGMICLVAFLNSLPSERKHKPSNVAAVESGPSTTPGEEVNDSLSEDGEKPCFFCGK